MTRVKAGSRTRPGRSALPALYPSPPNAAPDLPLSMTIREDFGTGLVTEIDIEEVLFHQRTRFHDVLIAVTRPFGKGVFMDGNGQSFACDQGVYHEALVHPAMLLHPKPRRVLIGGGGEGATLREASHVLETYSPTLDADLEGGLPLADLGNMELPEGPAGLMAGFASRAVFDLAERGVRPIILGGEHSITPGAVASCASLHQGLLVIRLDAHADLREEYEAQPHSHACPMRRCLDHIPEHALLQVGVRSGTREEWEEMRAADRYVEPTADALRTAIESRGPERIYLSVDLDVFGPSVVPGAGTPEPGGIDWATFADLLGAIPLDMLVGADVMELAPEHDPTGRSAIVAAKVVREIAIGASARNVQKG